MKTSFFFVFRIAAAWTFAYILLLMVWNGVFNGNAPDGLFFLLFLVTLGFVIASAVSHLRRVRLIAGSIDRGTLANRQRRQIEIPFEAGEAFDLLDAGDPRTAAHRAGRERARQPAGARQGRAASIPTATQPLGAAIRCRGSARTRNQILATVTPGDGSGSVTLICEPESGAWSDWFRVDDGTNLENAEAITRAITRRVAERRRNEQAAAAADRRPRRNSPSPS